MLKKRSLSPGGWLSTASQAQAWLMLIPNPWTVMVTQSPRGSSSTVDQALLLTSEY
jgi:hypothetical protein